MGIFSYIRISHIENEAFIRMNMFLSMFIWTKVTNFTEKYAFNKKFPTSLRSSFLFESELLFKSCTWRNIRAPNLHMFTHFSLSDLGPVPLSTTSQSSWLLIPRDLMSLIIFSICSLASSRLPAPLLFFKITTSRINAPENLGSGSAVSKVLWGHFGNSSNGFHDTMAWKLWWILSFVKLFNWFLTFCLWRIQNPMCIILLFYMMIVTWIEDGRVLCC